MEIRTEDDPELLAYTHDKQIDVHKCKQRPINLPTYLKGAVNGILQVYVDKLFEQHILLTNELSSVTKFIVDEIER